MTNQAPNTRKLAQHIKNAGDRNERMLVRTITTILASVGTLVGWMALAADEPGPIVEAVAAEPTQTPQPAPTEALLLIPTATVAFLDEVSACLLACVRLRLPKSFLVALPVAARAQGVFTPTRRVPLAVR